eukprot:364944-Chlamydomonas_euryale.AAC.14
MGKMGEVGDAASAQGMLGAHDSIQALQCAVQQLCSLATAKAAARRDSAAAVLSACFQILPTPPLRVEHLSRALFGTEGVDHAESRTEGGHACRHAWKAFQLACMAGVQAGM